VSEINGFLEGRSGRAPALEEMGSAEPPDVVYDDGSGLANSVRGSRGLRGQSRARTQMPQLGRHWAARAPRHPGREACANARCSRPSPHPTPQGDPFWNLRGNSFGRDPFQDRNSRF
jgi:hypothetical protein